MGSTLSVYGTGRFFFFGIGNFYAYSSSRSESCKRAMHVFLYLWIGDKAGQAGESKQFCMSGFA